MPAEPEPTGWELHRDIQRLDSDVRDLNARLDKMPTQDLMAASLAQYVVQVASLTDQLLEVKALRERDLEAQRSERERDKRDRQWLIGAVLLPLAISVMSLIVALGGIR